VADGFRSALLLAAAMLLIAAATAAAMPRLNAREPVAVVVTTGMESSVPR